MKRGNYRKKPEDHRSVIRFNIRIPDVLLSEVEAEIAVASTKSKGMRGIALQAIQKQVDLDLLKQIETTPRGEVNIPFTLSPLEYREVLEWVGFSNPPRSKQGVTNLLLAAYFSHKEKELTPF